MDINREQLDRSAQQLAERLRQHHTRIVFAESCTAGLLSATLSQFPGISEYLCGSAVTYRNATKTSWLSVSATDLADPTIGAVSPQVAEQMCCGVLKTTLEADLAAAVTGHLGPGAPPSLDGVAYVCISKRHAPRPQILRCQLGTVPGAGLSLRLTRQYEVAITIYNAVAQLLESSPDPIPSRHPE